MNTRRVFFKPNPPRTQQQQHAVRDYSVDGAYGDDGSTSTGPSYDQTYSTYDKTYSTYDKTYSTNENTLNTNSYNPDHNSTFESGNDYNNDNDNGSIDMSDTFDTGTGTYDNDDNATYTSASNNTVHDQNSEMTRILDESEEEGTSSEDDNFTDTGTYDTSTYGTMPAAEEEEDEEDAKSILLHDDHRRGHGHGHGQRHGSRRNANANHSGSGSVGDTASTSSSNSSSSSSYRPRLSKDTKKALKKAVLRGIPNPPPPPPPTKRKDPHSHSPTKRKDPQLHFHHAAAPPRSSPGRGMEPVAAFADSPSMTGSTRHNFKPNYNRNRSIGVGQKDNDYPKTPTLLVTTPPSPARSNITDSDGKPEQPALLLLLERLWADNDATLTEISLDETNILQVCHWKFQNQPPPPPPLKKGEPRPPNYDDSPRAKNIQQMKVMVAQQIAGTFVHYIREKLFCLVPFLSNYLTNFFPS